MITRLSPSDVKHRVNVFPGGSWEPVDLRFRFPRIGITRTKYSSVKPVKDRSVNELDLRVQYFGGALLDTVIRLCKD